MSDTRYLEMRGQCFYVAIEVPPSIRPNLGKKRLIRSLKTRSLATAQKRRWTVIADLRVIIEGAREGREGDPVMSRALALREAFEAATRQDEEADGGPHDLRFADLVRELVELEDTRLEETRPGMGKVFRGLFNGTATPLLLHVDRWLAEGGARGAFEERTKKDHRRALERLSEWLAANGHGATLEVVTRAVAGRYVSEGLIPSGLEGKTIAKAISSLASYWQWLRRRGLVPDEQRSPWADQAPPKRARAGHSKEEERPFTDAEVRTLLAEPSLPVMDDFIRTALLSGMRREEIGRLTVADCQGGVFIVQRGKTDAARRRVPIHPGLRPMVTRRCAGKAPGDYLFHDLTSQRAERTDAIGKAFGRYRRTLGIQGGTGRRSTVNLHSARRWFVTAAINAGQAPHMVSLVVGHREGRQGMTMGRYWSGADDVALRAVVEAVTLPKASG